MKIGYLLGFGFISKDESKLTQCCGKAFDFLMLVALFGLPIDWLLESKNIIDHSYSYMINWLIWLLFVTEAITMLVLAKNKKHLFYQQLVKYNNNNRYAAYFMDVECKIYIDIKIFTFTGFITIDSSTALLLSSAFIS
ncbi:hypothetical protein AVM71_13720 [Piscirickettsia salmonis]|nr:hypothetical protein AVM71_13720 [Piscirickettsia salmonis]